MRNKRKRLGITIAETVVASFLLATALIPCLKALTTANLFSTKLERNTRSLLLARQKMEDIRAKAIYAYSTNFAANSTNLGDKYFCNVADTAITSNLRKIKVSAGFDSDSSSNLSSSETIVTLESLVARRWN
ncbi:MAG: hypothetical protein A2Y07_00400 [Planctomycetes bacterium GWF2_50_10]|nr:MAG: hypothetical protein A2Y07_00400 [Planctomycetes bacterium GWF2_50_10]